MGEESGEIEQFVPTVKEGPRRSTEDFIVKPGGKIAPRADRHTGKAPNIEDPNGFEGRRRIGRKALNNEDYPLPQATTNRESSEEVTAGIEDWQDARRIVTVTDGVLAVNNNIEEKRRVLGSFADSNFFL